LSLRLKPRISLLFPLAPLALFAACSASGGDGSKTNGNGDGDGNGATSTGSTGGTGPILTPTAGSGPTLGGSSSGGGSGDQCGQVLPVIYRDFNAYGTPGGHDDFEASARGIKNQDGSTYQGWNDVGCGLVEPALGADGKPVAFAGMPDKVAAMPAVPAGTGKQRRLVSGPGCYTAANPTPTGICGIGTCMPWDISPITYAIKSASTFAQWYTTTAGVNMEVPGELLLVEDPAALGSSVFDSNAFFPIDNKGFGNTAGQQHNYHFTTEIHVKFKYERGQKFTFRGDDDLWIFVNGKLALDVGGQHQALEGTIDFDLQAATLGITAGSTYPMDIFHAERQTDQSNFRIQTNIKCFEPVVK
jgi:fibro-slime domain-containing protein